MHNAYTTDFRLGYANKFNILILAPNLAGMTGYSGELR